MITNDIFLVSGKGSQPIGGQHSVTWSWLDQWEAGQKRVCEGEIEHYGCWVLNSNFVSIRDSQSSHFSASTNGLNWEYLSGSRRKCFSILFWKYFSQLQSWHWSDRDISHWRLACFTIPVLLFSIIFVCLFYSIWTNVFLLLYFCIIQKIFHSFNVSCYNISYQNVCCV